MYGFEIQALTEKDKYQVEKAETLTVRISGESPCGVVSALVRFGGKAYWWVD
jgi:hypothetical protein